MGGRRVAGEERGCIASRARFIVGGGGGGGEGSLWWGEEGRREVERGEAEAVECGEFGAVV